MSKKILYSEKKFFNVRIPDSTTSATSTLEISSPTSPRALLKSVLGSLGNKGGKSPRKFGEGNSSGIPSAQLSNPVKLQAIRRVILRTIQVKMIFN